MSEQQGEQYGPDPSETVDTNAGPDAESGHIAEADEEETRKTADAPSGQGDQPSKSKG